jgi:hypothetical protein
MKMHITKISVLTLCAAAVLAVPALTRAQDTTTNAPAAAPAATPVAPPAAPGQTTQPKLKKLGTLPFHGDLVSVDTNAMTFVVGKRTFEITSGTRITKDDKPAVLEDGVVGQPVSGSYKKNADGGLDAVTVHFGGKNKKEATAAN